VLGSPGAAPGARVAAGKASSKKDLHVRMPKSSVYRGARCALAAQQAQGVCWLQPAQLARGPAQRAQVCGAT